MLTSLLRSLYLPFLYILVSFCPSPPCFHLSFFLIPFIYALFTFDCTFFTKVTNSGSIYACASVSIPTLASASLSVYCLSGSTLGPLFLSTYCIFPSVYRNHLCLLILLNYFHVCVSLHLTPISIYLPASSLMSTHMNISLFIQYSYHQSIAWSPLLCILCLCISLCGFSRLRICVP